MPKIYRVAHTDEEVPEYLYKGDIRLCGTYYVAYNPTLRVGGVILFRIRYDDKDDVILKCFHGEVIRLPYTECTVRGRCHFTKQLIVKEGRAIKQVWTNL